MEKKKYAKFEGLPPENGIYFVDDEEYGELSVIHLYSDVVLNERRCRIIGWDNDLGEDSMSRMVFYGPIPPPSNSSFSLYDGEEDAGE